MVITFYLWDSSTGRENCHRNDMAKWWEYNQRNEKQQSPSFRIAHEHMNHVQRAHI